MTGKISKETRQKIHELHAQNKSVKEILETLKAENISISDSTIRRTIKNNTDDKEKNVSFISIKDDSFDEEFSDYWNKPGNATTYTAAEQPAEEAKEQEANIQQMLVQHLNDTRNICKEEVQKVFTVINKDITESNDKLDEIMKETKKKLLQSRGKAAIPLGVAALQAKNVAMLGVAAGHAAVNVFNTDGLTEQEKRFRRDLIIKIRNYLDCFSDHEIIQNICGDNPVLFKQKLYEKDLATLNIIYEEIQIGINQSKDYEQFMNMFSTSLKCAEFISSIMLGINISGLKDDILEEISEFDLRQLACELSVSRYISPKMRLMIITLKILLKKVLSNDLLNKHQNLKIKLAGYYQTISKILRP